MKPKRRKNKRHCELITCCGKTFPLGMLRKHKRGLLHRSSRLKKLIAENRLSQRAIAKSLNVSSEYVRQIVSHFEMPTGFERSRERALATHRNRILKANSALTRFIKECEKQKLHWKLRSDPEREYIYFSRSIIVQGLTVLLRKARYNSKGHVILRAVKAVESLQLVAYELSDDWLIFPAAECPKSSTMFSLRPNNNGTGQAANIRHDYGRYLNNWTLLRRIKFNTSIDQVFQHAVIQSLVGNNLDL